MQYRVIKHVAVSLASMLERSVSSIVDRPIRVLHAYAPDAAAGNGALTLLQCGLEQRPGSVDREHEITPEGERFRNPPMLLRARYLVSAWATPPDDQELLGAVLRTFLDHDELQLDGEAEQTVAYAGVPAITLQTLDFEEQRRLASGFGMPLAPSVSYWVEFQLQSGQTTPIRRVKERVVDFRKIDG